MRFIYLILNEFRFLYKYGIIMIYSIFTLLYLCLLAFIPENARQTVSTILIFTDPAAMGLFFMGAVVLLEKSQRVSNSLAVSPVHTSEYILAKVLTIMATGCVIGLILCLFAKSKNILLIMFGISLSSIVFSLVSLIVASKAETLNGFMIATVPFEIAICLPPLLYLFDVISSPLWIIHPGVAAIRMINNELDYLFLDFVSIACWIALIFMICRNEVKKSFRKLGGASI